MNDARSHIAEHQDLGIHPALISFLHGTPDKFSWAGTPKPRGRVGDDSLDDTAQYVRPSQPGRATMRVLLVSPPSPFGSAVADALGRIDAASEITRVSEVSASGLPRGDDAALALIDLDAFPVKGEALIHELAVRRPGIPIVALSSSVDRGSVDRALNAGAVGYLPKTYTEPLIEGVLRLVIGGETYRPHNNTSSKRGRPARERGADSAARDGLSVLTPREREVLIEVARGCSNLEIANRLGMEEPTVKTHMHKIFRKLHVQNRAAAALCGARMSDIQQSQIEEAERGKLNLSWLQPEMTHRRVRSGEWIFRLGDVGSELFYVQRGSVTLPEIGVTIRPGEVFGEIGIFTPDHKRTCSARCDTDVDLFSLTSGQVRRIYFGNPQFAFFILTLVATRLMADRRRAGT